MSFSGEPRAWLAWWFVFAYFLGAIVGVWAYILNPDAAMDQSVDGVIIRVTAAMSLLPLAIAILLQLPSLRQSVRDVLEAIPIIKWVLLISSITFAVGIVQGNAINFVAGDTYKLLTLPIGLLAGLALPLRPMVRAFAIMGIINCALFIVGTLPMRLTGDLTVVGLGTFHILIPLSVFPWFNRDAHVQRAALIAMVVTAIVLGLKRSTMVILIAIMGILSITERAVRPVLLFVVILAVGIVAIYGEEIEILNELYDRVTTTYEGGAVDSSTGSRVQEVKSSWGHLQDSSQLGPIQIAMLGLGSGATYLLDSMDLRLNTVSEDTLEVHNIHFTPMTLIFRHGIVPAMIILGAYFACFFYCLRVMWRNKGTELCDAAYVIFLFGQILLLSSLSGFTIVGDLMLPVLMGSLIRAVKSTRSAQPDAMKQKGVHAING